MFLCFKLVYCHKIVAETKCYSFYIFFYFYFFFFFVKIVGFSGTLFSKHKGISIYNFENLDILGHIDNLAILAICLIFFLGAANILQYYLLRMEESFCKKLWIIQAGVG